MPSIEKRWQVAAPITEEVSRELSGYHPILRQILSNRGYTSHETARQFLRADIPSGCEPENLTGIPQAVDRLCWAIQRRELIAVYGDYDADGVTATALLSQALQALGAQVRGYIPNRFDEGYGLNNDALETLTGEGVAVVVTVDCGIRSLEEANHARSLGLDLIISDHHHPGLEIPHALAVINPKQSGCTYPEKDLAGVGLAYKLAAALFEQLAPETDTTAYLDLVALGTVADLAPLLGENRALVRAGLKCIQEPRRQGLQSLLGVAGLKPNKIQASDIGFMLGPRLNAAGRLQSAEDSLELLLTQDIHRAGQLAQQLDVQNRERQRLMQEIQEQAEVQALVRDPDGLLLFAADPDFNPGVVGLAASRLTERYYRPSIVAQQGEEFTRASCRSIPEFHITEALDQCNDLLEHHGGHAAAAGFTVRNQNLPELVERLQTIARETLGLLDLRPTINVDVDLPLSELHPRLLEPLISLQPTGHKNPQATFVSRNLKVSRSRTVGKDNSHLKLTVTDGRITYDAIAFRLGHLQENLPSRVDLLYTFELNEYNGSSTVQLNVRDLKPAEG